MNPKGPAMPIRTLPAALLPAALLLAAATLTAGCAAEAPADEDAAVAAESDGPEAVEARNIETVRAFYQAALNDKDAADARSYLGAEYIQHNPAAQDGVAGLEAFIGFLASQFPQNSSEIVRAFADGDHVILHVRNQRGPDQPVNAIMEIFRLADGKIVEHWDVVQPVPAETANDNGMF
jgi:predicted SnoaL-like aldol condensation-catalyzing enzyme